MTVELAIAALCSGALAVGHTAIGRRWVLPMLGRAQLPSTPIGPSAMTLSMVRFTWHVVSVMLAGFGVLFAVLAAAPHADLKTLLLRWLAVLWLTSAAVACWPARRRLRTVLRFPVPVLLLTIAAMCWAAST